MVNTVAHLNNKDVLHQILSRLPIPELQEVRLVCKKWNEVATNVFWKLQCEINWGASQPCNDSWKARFQSYRNWEKSICFIETYPNFLPPHPDQSSWYYTAQLFQDHLTQTFWDEKYNQNPPVIYLNNWPNQEIIEITREETICKLALSADFLAILNDSKNVEIYDKHTTGSKKRIIKAAELGLVKEASCFNMEFQNKFLIIWNSHAKRRCELEMRVWDSSKDRIYPVISFNGRPINTEEKCRGDRIEMNSTFPRDFTISKGSRIGKDNENEIYCHNSNEGGIEITKVPCNFKILDWMTDEDKIVICAPDRIQILNFTEVSPIQSILPPTHITKHIQKPLHPAEQTSKEKSKSKLEIFYRLMACIKFIWSKLYEQFSRIFRGLPFYR